MQRPKWVGYVAAVVSVAALTTVLNALESVFPMGHYPIPYVLLTMVIAYVFGLGPAISSCVAGYLAFDYFFVPPLHTFWPIGSTPDSWARHTAFILGVIVVSIATAQARASMRRIQGLADEATRLNTSLRSEIAEREHAQEAQSRLAAIVQSSDDAIIGKSLDGTILSWNKGAERIYGYSEPEVLGNNISILVPMKHRDELAGILETIRRGEYVHHYEIQRLTKDGCTIQVSISVSPIKDKAGEIVGASTIARDITERVRSEIELQRAFQELDVRAEELEAMNEELRATNEELNYEINKREQAEDEIKTLNTELEQRVAQRTADLEAANRELEAFSYSVSHDLRAPLRAIDGFSNSLLKLYQEKLDERGQDYLQRVRNAAQRMGRLIDDILGLSRASRADMHRQRVNLSQMAQDVLDELRSADPEREAEVSVAPGLVVNADAHLIRIVLQNLLGNAWKFTAKRDVAYVEVGKSEQNGEQVFYVKDNGAGFNSEYADKLFSPFQRLHSESEFSGTGIGLALVQRILRRHGGRIWAESTVEHGATFYFTLGEANR